MNHINIKDMTMQEVTDHIKKVSPNTMTAYVVIQDQAVPISISVGKAQLPALIPQ